jgi:hypothetical protein
MPPILPLRHDPSRPSPPPATIAAGSDWRPLNAWPAPVAPRPKNPLEVSPRLASRESSDALRSQKTHALGIPHPSGRRALGITSRASCGTGCQGRRKSGHRDGEISGDAKRDVWGGRERSAPSWRRSERAAAAALRLMQGWKSRLARAEGSCCAGATTSPGAGIGGLVLLRPGGSLAVHRENADVAGEPIQARSGAVPGSRPQARRHCRR